MLFFYFLRKNDGKMRLREKFEKCVVCKRAPLGSAVYSSRMSLFTDFECSNMFRPKIRKKIRKNSKKKKTFQ